MKSKISIGFILISISLFSQNNLLNEAKYWMWRDRLVNDWMVPNYTGDYAHKGRGIIFKKRGDNWWQDLNYVQFNADGTYINPTGDSITSYSGGFDIGDEGFELGKYLIVLATEWRLLFNSGLPTEQTEAEIFWALKTIDRLDYDAETYWSYFWSKGSETWGGQRNGFMIRDDVFTNFLWYNENYPTRENADSNYFKFFEQYYNTTPYLLFNSDAYENYRYLNQGSSGNIGKYIDQNIMLCNPSKNKIYDLRELMRKIRYTHHLNGHFIEFNNDFPYLHITEPYGINEYYYPDNGGFSAAMAGLYACFSDSLGCAHYNRKDFREHHWTGPEEYSQDNYIGLLQGLVAVEQLVNSNVNVNGNGLASYAKNIIKRIINSIKNNESYNNNWIIDNPVTKKCVKGVFWEKVVDNVIHGGYDSGRLDGACNQGGAQAGSYSGQFAKVYEKYVGENLNGQWFNGVIGGNNALLSAILVTLSGYLPSNVIGLFQNDEEKLEHINKKCCKDWIDHDVSDDNEKEFQYLDLLFCYLHGLDEPYRGYQHYEDIINSTICPNNELVGNLLSEMIIHNLLKILRGEKYNFFIRDNKTYPYLTSCHNGLFLPCLKCNEDVVTYNKIESTATISSQEEQNIFGGPCKANVTYKAGKEIHLKPGFKVINGAKFHGYIEPMDVCPIKEGNPDVAVLFFPPSNEHLSPYVSNLNFTKCEQNIENDTTIQLTNNNEIIHNAIRLLPNPAKDMLVLQSNEIGNYFIEVYDMMGLLIEKDPINTNENISVGHLKRGVYIFKIFNQNDLVQIQKIILQ